jgi:hypothetical protein
LCVQIDTHGERIDTFDISSNGEVLVFGDSGGFMHLWSSSEDFIINNYSKQTELPVSYRSNYQITEDGFDQNI